MSVSIKVVLVSFVLAAVATSTQWLATADHGNTVYSQSQSMVPGALARAMHDSYR
ncbi:MAG: hypothetical protein AB4040_18855 [Synechococcus sp.]